MGSLEPQAVWGTSQGASFITPTTVSWVIGLQSGRHPQRTDFLDLGPTRDRSEQELQPGRPCTGTNSPWAGPAIKPSDRAWRQSTPGPVSLMPPPLQLFTRNPFPLLPSPSSRGWPRVLERQGQVVQGHWLGVKPQTICVPLLWLPNGKSRGIILHPECLATSNVFSINGRVFSFILGNSRGGFFF